MNSLLQKIKERKTRKHNYMDEDIYIVCYPVNYWKKIAEKASKMNIDKLAEIVADGFEDSEGKKLFSKDFILNEMPNDTATDLMQMLANVNNGIELKKK